MCLNGKPCESVPTDELDKVCFIVCNSYSKEQLSLGMGPLNDGYNVWLSFIIHGCKIFYLHNPVVPEFVSYLKYFLQHTQVALTIYYSGRTASIPNQDPSKPNTTAIVFDEGNLSSDELLSVLVENARKECRVTFISECRMGGAICQLDQANTQLPNILLISGRINPDVLANQALKAHKLHSIFSYYLVKVLNEQSDITPLQTAERVDPLIRCFNITTALEASNTQIEEQPVF